ncbi:MAG: ketopantoate reductase family protein [Natronomonas sp.]
MHIVVVGAGSIGCLLGGLLAREHTVTIVGRAADVEAIRNEGVELTGAIEETTVPAASTTAPETADVALVAVKSFDTEDAAETLDGCELRGCLSVQNGMGNERLLADALSVPVLAGICSYGAVRRSPGRVACRGVGEVVLGPRNGGRSELAAETAAAFRAAGVEARLSAEMPRQLWRKLAVNAGINTTTALARVQNGAVREGPAAPLAAAAAREVAAVARAEGVELTDEAAVSALETTAADTAENTSSMLQDVRAGRRTEIESIGGHVLEAADDHGIETPVTETTTRLLRAWESGRGLRDHSR